MSDRNYVEKEVLIAMIKDKYVQGNKKRNAVLDEVMQTIDAAPTWATIYGYRVHDLMVFAEACREQGISKESMRDFVEECGNAVETIFKAFKKQEEQIIKNIYDKKMRATGDMESAFRGGKIPKGENNE